MYSNAHIICGIGSIAGKKEERKKRKEDRKKIRKEFKGKDQVKKMAEWRKANGTKTGKFLQKVAKKPKMQAKHLRGF